MTDKLKYFLGSGCYSGLSPLAPGTVGSATSLLIIFGCIYAQKEILLIPFILFSAAITFWAGSFFENNFGKDPGIMVSDEWAGQALTFAAIPFSTSVQANIIILLTGFILFRFFDILKPLGIKKLQNLKSSWGILCDDLLAGLYAFLCIKTLIFLWPKFFGMA